MPTLGRLAFRTFLVIAIVAIVAGCSSPEEPDESRAPPLNETNETPPTGSPDMTGCTPEDATGTGTGDITSDRQCPDGNMTAPGLP